jgi:hypothetical protein
MGLGLLTPVDSSFWELMANNGLGLQYAGYANNKVLCSLFCFDLGVLIISSGYRCPGHRERCCRDHQEAQQPPAAR